MAKGIGQGISTDGYNVFGQLANNLGKNGYNIASYVTGAEDRLKEVISNNLNGREELLLTDANIKEISDILSLLL